MAMCHLEDSWRDESSVAQVVRGGQQCAAEGLLQEASQSPGIDSPGGALRNERPFPPSYLHNDAHARCTTGKCTYPHILA